MSAASDDVNELDNSLDGGSSRVWLGDGGSTTTSYTGLRFTNVAVPRGALISSAYLQVYSTQSQWISYAFIAAAEASGNSASFTSASRPSQRTPTASTVSHDDNVNWMAGVWYSLDEMKSILQEVVNRSDWESGNSVSIVLKGFGSGAFGRKFVSSFEGGAANAPRLIVSYSPASSTPPTATLNVSSATIVPGQSSTLSWTTTNAASASIDQGIGAVSTSGSIAVSPTTTTTYTLSASGSGGTATASATIAVGQPPTVSFSALPEAIAAGSSSTLSWTTGDATSVTIDNGIGSVPSAGSRAVTPSATTTYSLTATNAWGTTTTAVAVTVDAPARSLVVQVSSSGDDVNELNSILTANDPTLWIGNGGSSTTSFTGLRFVNLQIPAGATISSASLQVYSSQSQWIDCALTIAADAAGSSAAFSSSSLPSQRVQTRTVVSHSDNVGWEADTWYALDEIKGVVQEIVSRADWQPGNSLSLILSGAGSESFARKFVGSFDASPETAPRLILSYTTDGATPPTASIAVAPTTIQSGDSATLSWSTTNASTVTVDPGIGAVSASGSLVVSPSSTTTYTITASNQAGIATQATTLTVSPPTSQSAYFGVAPGVTEVIPHQIVRTTADLLYVFAPQQPYSTTLVAYWTANAGLPVGTADFSRTTQASLSAVPISISPAYDGGATVQITANLQDGTIVNVPFDLTTNTFGAQQVIATNGATLAGEYIGTSGVSSMFDANGALHVVYWSSANQIIHTSFTTNGDTELSQISPPVRVDANGSARHPSLAVSPTDNSVTIAWVSLATTPARILARARDASGTWSGIQNASNTSVDVWISTASGIDIDQGPSLIITPDGVKHLTYIENYDLTGDYGAVHYASNSGAAWTDLRLTATYSHDPALATNAAGELYLIGHGHPNDAAQACKSMDDICVARRNSDGTWAPPSLFARAPSGASFDSSPSIKWSVVGWNRPDTIEFVFFLTPYFAPTVYYGRLP